MKQTPEERAIALVTAATKEPGSSWFVSFQELGKPFFLGPYENPANAKEDAEQVRQFVAAVIREARQEVEPPS